MSFATGARRGPYEIQRPLGAGGMGEVYCARDTRLGRDVAIKVLPAALAPDPDRLARFRREAQLLAALNHPNIAAIYGLEESDGALHLVMELVEGPTLAERIAQGPIPLAEALVIARQIAEGLEYAHERGIIHRDLKPANIKVTPNDKVKILDFGLAKAVEDTPGETASIANSPTLSMAATKVGIIIGTAGYMSPEQAKGKTADRRADIWAFGVVLFEMLTGRQLYTGETASEVLAYVITGNHPWESLPPSTPAPIQKLLRRCLEKDPQRRLRDIGEARIAIEEYVADPAGASVMMSAPPPRERPRRVFLPWTIAGILALALALATVPRVFAPPAARPPLVRLEVNPGPDAALRSPMGASAILSSDGTRLVYVAAGRGGRTRLATRLLEQPDPIMMAGTEGGRAPFFSPDGQWIGFFADNKLKKIAAVGGAPVTLCDADDNRGASWGDDGSIVFATSRTSLSRVSSAGGAPVSVIPLAKGEATQRWPQVLPGSRAVLFTSSASRGNFEDASIGVVTIRTGERKTLQRGGTYGRFVPSGPGKSAGHLLYLRPPTLFAVPLDLGRLELTGTPVPVLENVSSFSSTGGGHFAFSGSGTFLYVGGGESRGFPLYWLDAAGKVDPLRSVPSIYLQPRVSPDGTRLAVATRDGGNQDVWVYTWARDTMTRLTFDAASDGQPVWSPDGKSIVFNSDPNGSLNLYWVRADGGGQIQRLTENQNPQYPYSFSGDGTRLAFSQQAPDTGSDLWVLPLETAKDGSPKPGKPEPFLQTKAAELNPAFSPDGKWVAYASNESGTFEIYVRPFPGPGGKWQISSGGGHFPLWSRTAPELFYVTAENRLMVARYKAAPEAFVAEKPRVWTEKLLLSTGTSPNWDLMPDGKRIAAALQDGEDSQAPTHVILLLNFFDELHRRVPAGRK